MIINRYFDEQLAQAGYLVGCPGAGEAIVIDAPRHFEAILEDAAKEGMRIVAVTETHIHADYLSGSRELAAQTGATLYLTREGTPDWQYAFAAEANVRLIGEGDTIQVGAIVLRAMHTPGHTPEHLAFVLTDTAASPEPCCVFTGDFLFAGDVGRPDLLERAAGLEGTMEAGAKALYATIQRFLAEVPEYALVWPAHGAGSACGKSLGGVPATTVGYERRTNWALKTQSEAEFVAEVLSGQPEPPRYFKEMKRLNKAGPQFLNGFAAAPRKWVPGSLLVDLRPLAASSLGTLPEALCIPFAKSFSTYAGALIPFDVPVTLFAESEAQAIAAKRALEGMGYDEVVGWVGTEVLEGQPLARTQRIDGALAHDLATKGALVLDVRRANERGAGFVEGSVHIPLGSLPERASELPNDREIVIHCASGYRSQLAAAVLRRAGLSRITSLDGGYRAWASTEPALASS